MELEINKQEKNSQKYEMDASKTPVCQRRNHRGNYKYEKESTQHHSLCNMVRLVLSDAQSCKQREDLYPVNN